MLGSKTLGCILKRKKRKKAQQHSKTTAMIKSTSTYRHPTVQAASCCLYKTSTGVGFTRVTKPQRGEASRAVRSRAVQSNRRSALESGVAATFKPSLRSVAPSV